MKASKSNKDITITGKVVLKKFARGSKSEHDAICLETEKESYILKRIGGNPFNDAVLKDLVGKVVTAIGFKEEYLFMVKEIAVDKR